MFMLLMPKRVKYRKTQRGRMKGKAYRGCDLLHGEVALQTTEPCWITDRQIEAARIAINRYIKRGGKLWIRIFPDKSTNAYATTANSNSTTKSYTISIWIIPRRNKRN